ncbi:hypothetical protein Anas_07325 [Armadillidium nasatum]|uniref:Uncharacterized protein n=1 Tax=Armadillidium nasatum TaxID=96803 RepID=A0A5N5T9X5_9CRUS|nr:hypothetical protein Anas_07325 [Armadillidium nasatum]
MQIRTTKENLGKKRLTILIRCFEKDVKKSSVPFTIVTHFNVNESWLVFTECNGSSLDSNAFSNTSKNYSVDIIINDKNVITLSLHRNKELSSSYTEESKSLMSKQKCEPKVTQLHLSMKKVTIKKTNCYSQFPKTKENNFLVKVKISAETAINYQLFPKRIAFDLKLSFSNLFFLNRANFYIHNENSPNNNSQRLERGCLYQNIDSSKLREWPAFNHSDWTSLPILPNDKSKEKDGNVKVYGCTRFILVLSIRLSKDVCPETILSELLNYS